MHKIILFDGMCSFCNWNVQFIIKRDPKAIFKFAPLESDIGQRLLKKYNIDENDKSLILIENDHCYDKSTAVFKICKQLTFVWKVFAVFIVIPKHLRDFGYTVIANSRYKLFSNKQCTIPSPDITKRFL